MHPRLTPSPVGNLLFPCSALRVASCPQDRPQVRTLECRDTPISLGETRGFRDPQCRRLSRGLQNGLPGIPGCGGIQRMLGTRSESLFSDRAWTSAFLAPEEVGACVASPHASWAIGTVVRCRPQSLASPFLEIGAYGEHSPSVGCCSLLHICGRILVRILTDSASVAGNDSICIGEAALCLHTLNRWHGNAVFQALGLPLVPLPTPHAGGLKKTPCQHFLFTSSESLSTFDLMEGLSVCASRCRK